MNSLELKMIERYRFIRGLSSMIQRKISRGAGFNDRLQMAANRSVKRSSKLDKRDCLRLVRQPKENARLTIERGKLDVNIRKVYG